LSTSEHSSEATVRTASPAGWRAWLRWLLSYGRHRLAEFGLTLVLGFVVGAVALGLFAKLAEDVAEQETQQLDLATLHWIQQFRSPTMDLLAQGASLLGSELLVVAGVAVFILFTVQRRWGGAVALILVTGGAQLLNDILKELFQRTRPSPLPGSWIPSQSFSFPSGHAMVAAAFYGFLGYLAWRSLAGGRRWLVSGALLIVVILIGLSRMYLNVHYLTDVIAGYIAGFIWTDAVIVGTRWLSWGRARRAAPPSP
jgi:membrane-associated phospholipid phosphatase